MCVVLKLEVDTTLNPPSLSGNDLPIKLNTLEIAPELEIPTLAGTVGYTQPEIEAALKLVRDLPKAKTSADRENILVRKEFNSEMI